MDIDWKRGFLLIRQQDTGRVVKRPKSKTSREVPISPMLRAALWENRALRERVIIKTGGEKISREALRYLLTTVERAAGLPPKSIHKLRHTFATRFLEHRGDIENCRAMLGHSKIATTQIYLHASSKEAARIIQTFGSGER
jgi:integrase